MSSIVNNMQAMNASRNLNVTTGRKASNTEKLSSGYRINRAADDAAGLSISEKMRRQIRGLEQGVRNSSDGVSLCQVADGALAEVHDMLNRVTELTIQSANGTMTKFERTAIQDEVSNIVSEISRVGTTTTFNGMHIFDLAGLTKEELIQVDLVKSPSADKGYLSEAYEFNNRYYPSATMDFSSINVANIKKLYDKSFSFTCSVSCPETFEFKFIDGNGKQSAFLNPETVNKSVPHYYQIDIHGMTNGSQVAKALYNFVETHPARTNTTQQPDNGLMVSHSNILVKDKDSSKLILRSINNFATAEDAIKYGENTYKGSQYGQANFAEIKGSADTRISNLFPIQSGAEDGEKLELEIERMNSLLLGISELDVTTVPGCNDALERTEFAMLAISRQRAKIGAQQNRLGSTISNEDNVVENTAAAESRIRDMDMSTGMVMQSMLNILDQAGQSMLTQANQVNRDVIRLIS